MRANPEQMIVKIPESFSLRDCWTTASTSACSAKDVSVLIFRSSADEVEAREPEWVSVALIVGRGGWEVGPAARGETKKLSREREEADGSSFGGGEVACHTCVAVAGSTAWSFGSDEM